MRKGSKHSEETKAKIRQTMLRSVKTPIHCKNISISKSGDKHPNWRKPRSASTREKIQIGNIKSKKRNYELQCNDKLYLLDSRNLNKFCHIHKISYRNIMKTKQSKVPHKGWILKELSKPIIVQIVHID